jgi:hypothetical protein
MLHPLFSTAVHRPDLVVDHVTAYAALLQAEARSAGTAWMSRLLARLLVAVGALLTLVFAGVALMLGLLLDQFHWVLLAVPGTCAGLTLLAYSQAKPAMPAAIFADLKAQFDSDVRTLRSVS